MYIHNEWWLACWWYGEVGYIQEANKWMDAPFNISPLSPRAAHKRENLIRGRDIGNLLS